MRSVVVRRLVSWQAFQIPDDESIAMAKQLLADEGLFVGGSSAMNGVGAVRAARQLGLGPGKTIVTKTHHPLRDGGHRYVSSIFDGS